MADFVGHRIDAHMSEYERMNGYVILGEMLISSQERVIIGYRVTDRISENGTPICDFVTARTKPRQEMPREWYSGNYFSGFSTSENRQKAWADFVHRATY